MSLPALAATLGERVLVEMLDIDGRLHALVVRGRRVTHRIVGEIDAVRAELESLRFALHNQVLGHAAGGERLERRAEVLDRLLLGPLADLLGDGPLVLVPTGALHALPWGMLPRLRGRSLTVAPSATIWLRCATSSTVDGKLVLVGAHSAEQAADEVREIAADRPGATVLAGEQARVDRALTALDGAAIGHIASHGEFRVDNPLFSFLMLADGPLTVYDLTALRCPPGLLVLSGCDTGLAAVHPGDELMGLVAALLNMGTATVIASTGPVDDGATRHLMRSFYGHLATGLGPAAALAAAQASADPRDRASTDSFVCFGAG
ncbi:CHAT domain-containing protein [Dactylosporangium sp. CA-233914]|uniref:CHAT domain-containing protein n=1 Tax=Dactylosporangium sp. CA-233914 TaxID=3239934 RepID=UPI003D8CE09B